jgi:hypothetical protein
VLPPAASKVMENPYVSLRRAGVAHPVDMAAVAAARYDLFVSFLGQFYRT